MTILWMFFLGATLACLAGMIYDMGKQRAYWEGRRAGYARAIADTRNNFIK